MEYRKLQSSEIDKFVENRIEFVTSIRDIKNVDLFEEKTTQYIKDNINSENLLIYIATYNNEIIASCVLCIFQTIPLPSNYGGKIGELLNVYTKKEYRGNGHASTLIKLLFDEAKLKGVSKIILEYTDDGYPLYKSLGFKVLDRQMEYRF